MFINVMLEKITFRRKRLYDIKSKRPSRYLLLYYYYVDIVYSHATFIFWF